MLRGGVSLCGSVGDTGKLRCQNPVVNGQHAAKKRLEGETLGNPTVARDCSAELLEGSLGEQGTNRCGRTVAAAKHKSVGFNARPGLACG
jgi:hypothetical protein